MSWNHDCYFRKFLQICCVALIIGYVDAGCSEEQIAKVREKIANTKFALNTVLESVTFGLRKYESKNALSENFFTKMEGINLQDITTQNVTLLLKLADHLKEEEKAGKKTKTSQKELLHWLERHLQESPEKIEMKETADFLQNAEKNFRSEKLVTARAEQSTQLLFFYHLFLWVIYANVDEEEEKGNHPLNASEECHVLNKLNQQKREIADLIYKGPLTTIKQQLLLGTPSTAGGLHFRSLLNVAIQASVFPYVKDLKEKREIDFYCQPFKLPNDCFVHSAIALGKLLWNDEGMRALGSEELLTAMETEMSKWLQGENSDFLLRLLNEIRAELANVEVFFSAFFLLARFYRHLAEEIRRRYVQSPEMVEFMDLEVVEKMDQFVSETLAGNEQIFQGSEDDQEQLHLYLILMVVGPEIGTIGKENMSPRDSDKFTQYLGKATEAVTEIDLSDENRHFCKKLAIVVTWIAAWELMRTVENAPAKQKLMEEFEQKMAKWSEEIDKSRCLIEVSEFGHKLMKIVKPGVFNKGNAKYLHQILAMSNDSANAKFNFRVFSVQNEFHIKVARLLTQLQGQQLTDDIEKETLAILEEINRAEEKLSQKLSTGELLEFLKNLASSINWFESRIFHLKMGGKWTREQKKCLFKLVDILARIVTLMKCDFHASRELQAKLGYLAKELIVLKATIQNAFQCKEFAAKEFLESAVRFREALEYFTSLYHDNFTMEEELAKEYNEFAKRLERIGISGVQRDMFGHFNLEAVERIIGKAKTVGLEEKLLQLAIELLHAHNQSHAKQFAVVKVRGTIHMSISLGLIEYDFALDGPRRKKFRDNLGELTSVFSPAYSIPMPQWGMVEVGKADKMFYEMVQAGWHQGNYDYYGHRYGRRCRTFAYFFICLLFDGKCPPSETWPKNFVDLDRTYVVQNSVFAISAQMNANDINAQMMNKKKGKCELKEHRFEFQIEIDVPEKEGMYQTMLPPIVQYQTGKLVGFDNKGNARLEEVLTMVQVDAKELADKPEQTFEATLMAYACKPTTWLGFSFKKHAFVRKFRLRDRTNSTGFKTMGFPEEFDLLEQNNCQSNEQLPVIRITGIGNDDGKEEGKNV